jgi:hypothetical protein
VTGWHHDDHWLDRPVGEQVVEDKPGAAYECPGVVGIHGAMQQIEHRILPGTGFMPDRPEWWVH